MSQFRGRGRIDREYGVIDAVGQGLDREIRLLETKEDSTVLGRRSYCV